MSDREHPLPTQQMAAVAPLPETTEPEINEEIARKLREQRVRDHATLIVVAGPNPGQVFAIDKQEVSIGRDVDANVRIDDPSVSRHHAKIRALGSFRYAVEDAGSRNGVFVGATRVTTHELASGDRIQLGPRVLLRFALLDEDEATLQRELFESSVRDPLTKAYNKRYLGERLAAEIAHARRHASPLALLIFDLDEFKKINDRHGHLVGDAVLRAVAEHVRALIRTEDVFARFGGEEFVLLVRGPSDAVRLAERIRAAVSAQPIVAEGVALPVTVSIGVALLDECGPEADGSALLAIADERLLRAKREGRDRVRASD
jgi:diguanylate cyclase (GGDEF)-like protein